MSEQRKVLPGEARQKRQPDHQQQVEHQNQQVSTRSCDQASLSRRLSTPARFKPAQLCDNDHQATHQVHHSHQVITSGSSSSGRKYSTGCVESSSPSNNLNHHLIRRHSCCEQTDCLFNHHRTHHLHHPHLQTNHQNHQSASPSTSSSASDSAFSQSQSTLESDESEQSTCFRRSLKDSDRFSQQSSSSNQDTSHHQAKGLSNTLYTPIERRKQQASSKALTNGDHHHDDEQGESGETENQFKIIWRNLSYRVPEKRLARLASYLRGSWPWNFATNDKLVVDHHQLGGDEPTVVVNSREPVSPSSDVLEENLSDDTTTKSPTTGRPRRIIFSDLHGCVRSGQLTAILGPSGAGKTTFLKCLTNSIVEGVSGSIDISGGPTTSHHLKLCIIPQKGRFESIDLHTTQTYFIILLLLYAGTLITPLV